MSIGNNRYSATFIFSVLIISLVPLEAIGTSGSPATPSTQISLSGDYILATNGDIITNSDIQITFNVTLSSGNFTQGTYSYSGVTSGNGTFNETGTTIQIESNSSGYAILTYFANSTSGLESLIKLKYCLIILLPMHQYLPS